MASPGDAIAVPPPSSTIQEDAINKARTAFAKLQDDTLFQECLTDQESVQNVIKALFDQTSGHKRRKSTRLLDGFHRYTAWMNNISGSIDTAVQTSSGIACPVWAPIKLVLKLSQDQFEAIEHVLQVIEMISDNLPRLKLYEELHDDPAFRVGLVNLFTDIVEFAIQACQYLRRRAPTKLARLIGRSFKQELIGVVSRIERRTKNVDEMAGALSQARAARFYEEAQAKQKQESQIRCMQWLAPANIREHHERHVASRAERTCEWVQNNPTFQEWAGGIDDSRKRLLVIHGPPGCGKTVLSSFIYDTIAKVQSPWPQNKPPMALLFSFTVTDASRKSLDALARSLLSQVLEQDTSGEVLAILNRLMQRGPPSTSEMLITLREAVLALVSQQIYVIIDGIDECHDSAEDILQQLIVISRDCNNLRIVFFGRSHAFAELLSAPEAASIRITAALNHDDIKAFINEEVLQSKLLSDSSMHHAVSDTLLDKADGMFLWVKLMLDDLKRAASDDEILLRLTDLPQGLERAYCLILQRLIGRLDKHQQRLAQIALSFAAVSARPLKLEELRYTYAMWKKPTSKSPDLSLETYLLKTTADDIIDICGGLLVFDGRAFRLVHESALDYLSRSAKLWEETMQEQLNVFKVDIAESHQLLGDVCARYLTEVDCSQLLWDDAYSLEIFDIQKPLLNYACSFVAYHLNRDERPSDEHLNIILAFLDSDQCFFVLEYFFLLGLDDVSMHPHLEMRTFISDLFREGDSFAKAFTFITVRWEREQSNRISKFGEDDPRTARWGLWRDVMKTFLLQKNHFMLRIGEEDESIDMQNDSSSGGLSNPLPQVSSKAPTIDLKSALEKRTANRAVPRARTAPFKDRTTMSRDHAAVEVGRLKELLQGTNNLSLGRQFEFFARSFQGLIKIRTLIDPLETLWLFFKQKARTIPVIPLAAVAWYYHGMGKDDKAHELATVCLQRLGDRDTPLKILVRHLMGFILSSLDEHKIWKVHKLLIRDVYENLAWSQYQLSKYPEALLSRLKAIDLHTKVYGEQPQEKRRKLWLLECRYQIVSIHYSMRNAQETVASAETYLASCSSAVAQDLQTTGDRLWVIETRAVALCEIWSQEENDDHRIAAKAALRDCLHAAGNYWKASSPCRRAFIYWHFDMLDAEGIEFAIRVYELLGEAHQEYHEEGNENEAANNKQQCDAAVFWLYYLAALYQEADRHQDAIETLENGLLVERIDIDEHSQSDAASTRALLHLHLTMSLYKLNQLHEAVQHARTACELLSNVLGEQERLVGLKTTSKRKLQEAQCCLWVSGHERPDRESAEQDGEEQSNNTAKDKNEEVIESDRRSCPEHPSEKQYFGSQFRGRMSGKLSPEKPAFLDLKYRPPRTRGEHGDDGYNWRWRLEALLLVQHQHYLSTDWEDWLLQRGCICAGGYHVESMIPEPWVDSAESDSDGNI